MFVVTIGQQRYNTIPDTPATCCQCDNPADMMTFCAQSIGASNIIMALLMCGGGAVVSIYSHKETLLAMEPTAFVRMTGPC